jgi:ATP-binding cassette subfamily C (CFTR/MRP) protein 1
LYQPFILVLLPVFLFVCWKIGRFYMNCSRELTRIEGMLNSPVLNLINETLPGNTTIRAYNFEDKYVDNFYSKTDRHFKVEFYLNGISQWYLLTLNFLSFVFLAFIVVLTLAHKEKFSAKIIGLLLTYSIVLQEDIIEFLSAFANFENTMTKMERCLSYTHLPSERPQEINLDALMKWPTAGRIEFVHFSAQYRPGTEIVLKNLNFVVAGGEHIGVVGRTGSGKSTLALVLFRILEPLQGKILIDGIDIGIIGLRKLRRSLTIIPQDSTVMNGTLRYNIDPVRRFGDEEIVAVLRKIGFNYIVDNNPSGLDQLISENGNNLSIGEKQLICITRAILRKSKIIVMDEATASIDYKTEEIIQHAIAELLKTSTVITIAHRIKTIVNSDKIIVLDNGSVVEFDSPKNLLNNKNSLFYSFYSKSI